MIEKRIAIDKEKCRQDGLCSKICPMRIFKCEERETPRVENANICVLCGQCLSICPVNAINHSRLSKENLIKIEQPHPVSDEAMIALLRQRRSVRVFKDKQIPKDILSEIVNISGYCPTGAHGHEGWIRNVTVVTDKEKIKRIHDLTVEYIRLLKKKLEGFMINLVAHWIPEAQAGIDTLPDINLRLHEYDKGRDIILYDAPAAIFIHAPRNTSTPQADCDAALYSMMLLAQTKGLGTCWMGWMQLAAAGFQVRAFKGLKELLKIPKGHLVYSAMVIGYPKIKLHSIPPRETKVTWID